MNALLLLQIFKKPVGLLIACIAGMVLICTAAVLGGPPAGACTPGGTADPSRSIDADGVGPVGGWTADQVRNAAMIVATGEQKLVPARGWVIAVATAMQESRLINRPYGDRDSVGLFQQRPSQGWGTPEQLRNVRYAAGQFYARLVKVDGWERMSLTRAAQKVQRSAFPDLYQQWEDDAEEVVAAVAYVASIDDLPDASVTNCGSPSAVSGDGWTKPVRGKLGSGFRPPDRPGHDGVDIIAPRHTAIRAAAAGNVITLQCNSSIGTCDRDGSPSVMGCGWYLDIRHEGGTVTRYCHMVRRPEVAKGDTVTAGQVIGFVGSSGNSSGPHLHFEVHARHGAPATGQEAFEPVDPVVFLAQRGVKLTAA